MFKKRHRRRLQRQTETGIETATIVVKKKYHNKAMSIAKNINSGC
jgi:hypothetical protein